MKDPHKGPATYADLEALPETMVGQIIDGELIALPRPAVPHALSASNLGGDINRHFGRSGPPGGWWILDEPELHWGKDVLVPDLAGWRRERMPELPPTAFIELPPDWVCEVLSPSTASLDRVRKSRVYARNQVRYLWFVDPAGRTVETYRLEGTAWLQTGTWAAGEAVRAAPFDAVEFPTADWFLPPVP